jgi:hypothetical protein
MIRFVSHNHEYCVWVAFFAGIGIGVLLALAWRTFADDGYRWW